MLNIQQNAQVPISARQRAQIKALLEQYAITSYPYYSRVRVRAVRAEDAPGGPYTYTVPEGTQFDAFAYALDEAKTAGGFNQAEGLATPADTNIVQRQNTISGQSVLISGISISPEPAALERVDAALPFNVRVPDYRLLAALYEACSVEMSLNGDSNVFKLGALGNIGGGSALTGGAQDTSGAKPSQTPQQIIEIANAGWATRGNFFRLPEGLVWKPQGNPDASLKIRFRVTRTITIRSGTVELPQADQAAEFAPADVASNIDGYSFPTVLVQDFRVKLEGRVESLRTQSA